MDDSLVKEYHLLWSMWVKQYFRRTYLNSSGEAILPKDDVDKWHNMMLKDFSELTEKDKAGIRENISTFISNCKDQEMLLGSYKEDKLYKVTYTNEYFEQVLNSFNDVIKNYFKDQEIKNYVEEKPHVKTILRAILDEHLD